MLEDELYVIVIISVDFFLVSAIIMWMLSLIKNFIFSILVLVSLLFNTCCSVQAYDRLLFHDDFVDLSRWDVITGEESRLLEHTGFYTNYTVDAYNSSYIILKNPLPDGDIKIRVKIRAYDQSYRQGAGFAVSDSYIPKEGTGDIQPFQLITNIWPNSYLGDFGVPSSYCLDIASCVNTGLHDFSVPTPWMFEWNDFVILYEDSKYTFNNGISTFTTATTTRNPKYIWLGSPLIAPNPQDLGFFRFQVDSISAWQVNLPSPFTPYYSQQDESWIGETYDKADEWSRGEQGIDRWGCALTSAAMLLSKYDIKSPNGEVTTPKVLNGWLKSEPDGYVGQGLLNWVAVTRYAKAAKDNGHSPTALMFKREAYDRSVVSTQLADNELPIIQQPGHFALTYDEDGNNWVVADPLLSAKELYDKNAQVVNTNTLYKSNTDLSYFVFAMPYGSTATMTDQDGNYIHLPKFEEYLRDTVDASVNKPSDLIYLPRPANGTYRLNITYSDPTNLDPRLQIFLYTKTGEIREGNFVLPPGSSSYELQYNSGELAESSVKWVDNVAPIVPVHVAPADSQVLRSDNLILEWTEVFDTSGVYYEFEWRGDNGHFGPHNTGGTYGYDLRGALDGLYYWRVRACDQVGNCSPWSSEWSFVVDNTPPTSTITPIADPANWNGTVSGTADGTGSEITKVVVKVVSSQGSTYEGEAVGTTSWSYTIPTPNPGEYHIESIAYDAAGNVQATPSVVSVVVAEQVVELAAPKLQWAFWWGRILGAHWSQDTNSVKYSVWYGTRSDQIDKHLATTTHNIALGIVPKWGVYYVGVRAEDKYGNLSEMSNVKRAILLPLLFWH